MAEKDKTTVIPDDQAPAPTLLTQEDLDSLKNSLVEKDSTILGLRSMVFELEKEVNELNVLKRNHIAEIQAKDKIINALSDEIATLHSENDAPAVPTVKVGKKTYVIAIPRFNYGGKELTAADVKADAKLAAELVEAKSGVLVESV